MLFLNQGKVPGNGKINPHFRIRIVALVLFFMIIDSSAVLCIQQQAVDTLTIPRTPTELTDTDTVKISNQPKDSPNSANPAGFFSQLKKWANENQGVLELIALMLTVLGGIIAFFKIMLPRIRRSKKDPAEKGAARKRYLDHLINAHQHLPVAGFETNLRIPILLEKVYVTLRARLTDWERAGGEKELQSPSSQTPADRDLTVQEALKLALQKQYHGMVILGHPGSGKTTLAKYFALCFATNRGETNLGLPEKLLPILLFLREIDPQKTLIENLLAVLHKYDMNISSELTWKRAGQLCS